MDCVSVLLSENAVDFSAMLRERLILLDGAMGTLIQGLDLGDADFGGADYRMLSDMLVFSRPEAVRDIHLAYYRAGAHAVETNTFGASPFRLSEYDFRAIDTSRFAPLPHDIDLPAMSHEDWAYWLSRRGAELACEAREIHRRDPEYDGRPLFVMGSIGPSNRVLSSTRAELKTSTFDAIAENFRRQARGLIDGGADALLYETQQDILELKAAVFGGKQAMTESGRTLPIVCQVTVDRFSKMQIFNTDIHAALVTIEGIGIDAFGINCSIGPDLMLPTVEKLARFSRLPISVVPNAGLPIAEAGRTIYRFEPAEFARILHTFVAEYGVRIVGGCCGTTPAHIRAVADMLRGATPAVRTPEPGLYVSGPQRAILLDSSRTLIRFGERLNVRGSKKVRDAVESGGPIDHDALEDVVNEQVRQLGLDVIDVCMDSNTVDTTETLKEVIHVQTTDFPGAMCLDSFAVDALIEGAKVYPGRPILNSISMEDVEPGLSKADAVLRATTFHHPVYIGLCTGPKGPGATADEKVALALQIVEAAARHGVGPDQLFIDANVFPIGSESSPGMNFAVETLEAVRRIKELVPGIQTTLGVGNLTTGLASKPYMRMVLTSVFLDEARKRGLDAAIVNPNHYVFAADLDPDHRDLGRRVILEHDMDAFAELERIAREKKGDSAAARSSYDDLPIEQAICEKIKDGFKERENGSFEKNGHVYAYSDRIVLQAAQAVDLHAPLDFINDYLMAAMKELGDGFARGEVSLPHLLKSADVMQQVMRFLEQYMHCTSGSETLDGIRHKGTVVLGTVYQDVHSIGKDLAKTLLENYGYRVIDLGAMTPLQQFMDAAREHHADAIGMSALLVQTSNHMITVSKMMREQGLEDTPILIGGAPVNERHAAYVAMAGEDNPENMRGNVFYCRTAMDGVNVMNALMSASDPRPIFEKNRRMLLSKLERAEEMAREEARLLATLPRRTVSFEQAGASRWNPAHEAECARRRVEMRMRDFAERIDTRTLFLLNWRFGGTALWKRQNTDPAELERLFVQWVADCDQHGWIVPQGVMGIYPCQSEGENIMLYDPADLSHEIARFHFTTVIGSDRNDVVCGAQYFLPKSSGEYSAVGVQIGTGGPAVENQIAAFKSAGDSESALFLQGLSDRVAEDMAVYLHSLMRTIMGAGDDAGTRWSPGYPGMADIGMNRVIFDLLDAANLSGVNITDAGEFIPTGTTAAVVSFHPNARYS